MAKLRFILWSGDCNLADDWIGDERDAERVAQEKMRENAEIAYCNYWRDADMGGFFSWPIFRGNNAALYEIECQRRHVKMTAYI